MITSNALGEQELRPVYRANNLKKVDIPEALKLLQNGDVVAIPTETVYGLGGWIESEVGLQKIFSTKERPFFDPLIVHVDSVESARKLSSEWTEAHDILAKSCWPGPLTLITKKHARVNPLITSGLDSVGVRCPDHALTLELLKNIPGGIAAPSANKFGKTSPTEAQHVYAEFGESVAIIDGGPSKVGIESTVAGVVQKDNEYLIEIYRPGHFTASMLKEILQKHHLKAEVKYCESPVAPGQLKHHYMPKIPLVIVPERFEWSRDRGQIEEKLHQQFTKPALWQQPLESTLASRELYQKMREFDLNGHDLIITFHSRLYSREEWKGIWNRLEKAASLSLV